MSFRPPCEAYSSHKPPWMLTMSGGVPATTCVWYQVGSSVPFLSFVDAGVARNEADSAIVPAGSIDVISLIASSPCCGRCGPPCLRPTGSHASGPRTVELALRALRERPLGREARGNALVRL